MKKLSRLALYGAGNLSSSPLFAMDGLAVRLGPVQSSSLRVASRLANGLRAGYPVADFQDFEDCPLVLISVPESIVSAIVADLVAAPVPWDNRLVVLCSNSLGASELAPLSKLGAVTGSLAYVPGFEERWVVLEATRDMHRQMEPYFAKQIRSTLIQPNTKAAFSQALLDSGQSAQRMLDALRDVGVPRVDAGVMLERTLVRAVRSYIRSGKPK